MSEKLPALTSIQVIRKLLEAGCFAWQGRDFGID